MAQHIILNRFDGGHAESLRTTATNECEYSKNFDIFTDPHKLLPYGDSVSDASATANSEISDVDVSLVGSSYILSCIGYEGGVGGSTYPAFYTKANLITLPSQSAVSSANVFQKGSGVVYKGKFYALAYNGTNQYTLWRFDSASATTNCGSISCSSTFRARPFVHPEDNKLYIVIGTSISVWDNSSLSTGGSYDNILPPGFETVSLTDYGTYLAITMRPLCNNGNSVTYLWGRDATLTTTQGTINWGEGNCLLTENLYNMLFSVIIPQNVINGSQSGTTLNNSIIIKSWSGGEVSIVKSIPVSSIDNSTTLKIKNRGKLYFGFGGDDCVYVFGKNRDGQYTLVKDRYYNNSTAITSLYGISMVGDILWSAFATVSGKSLMRSTTNLLTEAVAYLSTSIYRTTINPSMPIADRGKNKKLDAVRITYTGKANGTVRLKYSVDGSTMTSIISESTTAKEDVKEGTMELTGIPLLSGTEFQFQVESIGGVEIKTIEYKYTVLNSSF